MNIATHTSRGGYALVAVLLLGAVTLTVLTATMTRTANSASLNERNNQYSLTLAAAEAATEKALAQVMAEYQIGGETRVFGNLDLLRTATPVPQENELWSRYAFSDATGGTDRTYIQRTTNATYVPLQSQYSGLNGWASTYRVISNARTIDSQFALTNAVEQEVQLASIPVFQFAIFYNSLLEFTWAAPFTIRGRIHANADIYTGSSKHLTVDAPVTTTGTIQKRTWAGYDISWMTGEINFNGGKATNASSLSLPIGTNNTASAVREIMNPPPVGELPTSDMGKQRYYNKSELLIEISSAGVITAGVKQPFDTLPVSIPATQITTFFSTSKTFTDQREGKTIKTAEVDVAKYITWAATNTLVTTKLGTGNPPNLLYIVDNRSTSSSELTGVRLVNGSTLPSRGLTVATPNPLYVLGHYNAPESTHRGTTNTTQAKPASLASDALTILSPAWSDSASSGDFKDRDATDTTINAAIITGAVYTGGSAGTSPFSGGVMNITRLLEDWGNGSKKLTLNTSIVNLFNSVRASSPWLVPGTYYYAPTRDFNFDPNFLDPAKMPPGTPELRALIRGKWSNPPPNTVNYAAN